MLTQTQFPVKEVQAFQDQLHKIQEDLHENTVTHEGKTAEEVYAERLAQLSLTDNEIQDGHQVVSALLARCVLWVEIIQIK